MKKLIILVALISIVIGSCKKDDPIEPIKDLASLSTAGIRDITTNSAISGGENMDDAQTTLTAKGVCWSTSPEPTIDLSTKTNDVGGDNNGPFESLITGLSENTTYFVRAYATNIAGTAYGNELSFTTHFTGLPTVVTYDATSITASSAFVGGSITYDGNSLITEKGIVWGITENPTIEADLKTQEGSGSTPFVGYVYGNSNTLYHARAYATNSTGIGYGNDITFTTKLAIGDLYQGGIIAYFFQSGDAGYDANVQHGIIAAPSDQSIAAAWANTLTTTGATGQAIGTGQANTTLIVNDQGAGSYAAKLCDDLVIDIYSDWYLPSMYELEKLYLSKDLIGGFAVAFYWGSSENDTNSAWLQSFNSNSQSPGTKTDFTNYHVRAVRTF